MLLVNITSRLSTTLKTRFSPPFAGADFFNRPALVATSADSIPDNPRVNAVPPAIIHRVVADPLMVRWMFKVSLALKYLVGRLLLSEQLSFAEHC